MFGLGLIIKILPLLCNLLDVQTRFLWTLLLMSWSIIPSIKRTNFTLHYNSNAHRPCVVGVIWCFIKRLSGDILKWNFHWSGY